MQYAFLDSFGDVVEAGSSYTAPEARQGCTLILGESPPLHSYKVEGVWVGRSEAPSRQHTWDSSNKRWVETLENTRARAYTRITNLRNNTINAPVEYDGAALDADPQAQKNVSSKISELQQRVLINQPSPPQLLVWRDADNLTHTFDTDQELLSWLGGLVIAMSQRGTIAYGTSWALKEMVDNATDAATIEAIAA